MLAVIWVNCWHAYLLSMAFVGLAYFISISIVSQGEFVMFSCQIAVVRIGLWYVPTENVVPYPSGGEASHFAVNVSDTAVNLHQHNLITILNSTPITLNPSLKPLPPPTPSYH